MANLIWPLFAIVFVSSTFSGIFGMAGGMILMAGLLLYHDPVEAILLHGVIQFFANGLRFFQLRHYVDLTTVRKYLMGSLLAFVVLQYVQFVPNVKAMYWLMGVGALMAAMNIRAPLPLKNGKVSLFAGFIVSSMQIAGVVGPMLDIISQDKKMSRHEAIGTKSIMVSISHLLKVLFMGNLIGAEAWGRFGVIELLLYVLMALIGTRLGKKVLDRISDKTFYRYTSAILLCLSVFYIWKAYV